MLHLFALRLSLLVSCLPLASVACAGSPAPTASVDTVSATRVAPDGTRVELAVDTTKTLICIEGAKEVAIDRVAKAVLKEGEYELRLEGSGTTRQLSLFNGQNFSEGERFFETDCLYELVRDL